MTRLRRETLRAVLMSVVALGATPRAVAQPTGSLGPGAQIAKAPSVQPVQVAEYYAVGAPITLDQAMKLSDTTKVMGPDCKLVTVAELKKLHAVARKAVEAPKKLTGGSGKVSYGPGSAKGREAAAVLGSVNADAQASRPAPGGTVRLNVLNRTPGIEAVNKKTSGFVVTPGAHLVISGWELGDAMGQVNLIGAFPPSGAVGMTIVNWKTGSIEVLMPTVTGVPDQPVSLQVITSARRTYNRPGGTFVATRTDTTITTDVLRYVKYQSGPSWGATMDANGNVSRSDYGSSITCKAVGTDTLTVLDLPKGFVLTEVLANWNGRTDAGDGDWMGFDGSRTYTQGYGFGDWSGPNLPVRWGVWRSHTSPDGALPSSDQCQSSYQISVVITGPAGLSPF